MFRPATESDLDACKALFGANVFGVIDMCQTFLPELLVAKGTIVNMDPLLVICLCLSCPTTQLPRQPCMHIQNA